MRIVLGGARVWGGVVVVCVCCWGGWGVVRGCRGERDVRRWGARIMWSLGGGGGVFVVLLGLVGSGGGYVGCERGCRGI